MCMSHHKINAVDQVKKKKKYCKRGKFMRVNYASQVSVA